MKCYKVEFLDEDGDIVVEFINASSYEQAQEMAQEMAGHVHYTLTLTGI